MRISTKSAAVAFAAAGLLASGGAAAHAEGPGPTDESRPQAPITGSHAPGNPGTSAKPGTAAKKVYKNVWHTASSYYTPYFKVKTGGKLYAGKSYFYCQENGASLKYKGYENDWWLKTDDDSGKSDVWVNAIFISGGSNNRPVAGVKFCTY